MLKYLATLSNAKIWQQKEYDALVVVKRKERNELVIRHNLYNRNDVSDTKLHQGLTEGTMTMKES